MTRIPVKDAKACTCDPSKAGEPHDCCGAHAKPTRVPITLGWPKKEGPA